MPRHETVREGEQADRGQSRRKRVAIVGGGCAALAAAWDLTSPHNPERCDVTIFQMGGRLGGKGASSRNADRGQRIEEHGLHLWLGYYENAFGMVRSCYEELKDLHPDDPELKKVWRATAFNHWDWRAAYERASVVGLADQSSGDWVPWVARFPEYVLSSDAVDGVHRTVEGFALPGIHITDDPRVAYPGESQLDGRPDLACEDHAPTVAQFLTHAVRELQAFVISLEDHIEETAGQTERAALEDDLDAVLAHAMKARSQQRGHSAVLDALRTLRLLRLSILVPAVQAVASLARLAQGPLPHVRSRIVAMLDQYVDAMRAKIEAHLRDDVVGRRVWELIDLLAANIRGLVASGLQGHDDLSSLDDWNYIDWLRWNRIAERTLQNPIVRGSHDLAFAYHQGHEQEPQFAAGQALNAAYRFFFTYKGALFWRMRAGMGDVVFAPLYMALRNRGVTFRFFHRLDDIELDETKTGVVGLKFQRQVPLKCTSETAPTNYEPLVLVGHVACWPHQPHVDQFDFDETTRHEYERAVRGQDPNEYVNFESIWCTWPPPASPEDVVRVRIGEAPSNRASEQGGPAGDYFDAAIVTVPVAGLGRVSRQLQEAADTGKPWRRMLENIGTVATQAIQLWTTRDTLSLGWTRGQVSFSAFVHPFDTWADLSHLVQAENQPGAKGVHYFCSTLPDYQLQECIRMPLKPSIDPRAVAVARATVTEHARRFLDDSVFQLWPLACHRYPNTFNWDVLLNPTPPGSDATPANAPRPFGLDALALQHVVANIDPSERYTQSLPGTTKYRLRPDQSGFARLFVAGDWTDCGLNLGCVEAAVISGRLASSAITRYPAPDCIPGSRRTGPEDVGGKGQLR